MLTTYTNPNAFLPCQSSDPDLWFSEFPDQVELAKQFCHECPVQATCLEGATARREPHGVWGGELFEQGRIVAHKHGRGRPRAVRVNWAALSRPPAAGVRRLGAAG